MREGGREGGERGREVREREGGRERGRVHATYIPSEVLIQDKV